MLTLTEQIIVDIIRHEMNLPANQVIIRSQNFKMPNDQKLYVIVGMIDAQVVSARLPTIRVIEDDSLNPVVIEAQESQMNEYIQIDILSYTNEAVLKKAQIVHALNSIYAKQKQEENFFKIARNTRSFVNSSYAEGGSNLNRFSLTVSCLTWQRQEKELTGNDYYDQFRTRVDDEKSIGTDEGIIEFEITPDTPPPPIIG